MTSYQTKTTELEAVNEMLDCAGAAPVAALTSDMPLDANRALRLLRFESRSLQARGWSFNTNAEQVLSRDVNGFIQIPTTYLQVDPSDPDTRYVVRGDRMYDPTEQTFVFTSDVTADVILLLPFEELPQSARDYLTIRAARRFQSRQLGDAESLQYSVQDEKDARSVFLDAEAEAADHNVIRDSSTVGKVTRYRGLSQ